MATLNNVSIDIAVVLGTSSMPIHQVLRLGRGAIIELDASEEDEVSILANNLPVAKGTVIVSGAIPEPERCPAATATYCSIRPRRLMLSRVPTRLARDLMEATVRACSPATPPRCRSCAGSFSSARPAAWNP